MHTIILLNRVCVCVFFFLGGGGGGKGEGGGGGGKARERERERERTLELEFYLDLCKFVCGNFEQLLHLVIEYGDDKSTRKVSNYQGCNVPPLEIFIVFTGFFTPPLTVTFDYLSIDTIFRTCIVPDIFFIQYLENRSTDSKVHGLGPKRPFLELFDMQGIVGPGFRFRTTSACGGSGLVNVSIPCLYYLFFYFSNA